MKTYISQKPYYVITKDGKFIAGNKVVIGRNIVTDATVEWFDTEAAYKARLEVVKSKTPAK